MSQSSMHLIQKCYNLANDARRSFNDGFVVMKRAAELNLTKHGWASRLL